MKIVGLDLIHFKGIQFDIFGVTIIYFYKVRVIYPDFDDMYQKMRIDRDAHLKISWEKKNLNDKWCNK